MIRLTGVILTVAPLLGAILLILFWKNSLFDSVNSNTVSGPGWVITDVNLDINWLVLIPILACFVTGLILLRIARTRRFGA
jgi:hypothetical protein